ncbi:MAG: hypothetical protein M8357_11760 [Desulfobulbaceae bacterium]|nr:hypothetical protein [Desulfobulbaceae bacterium]
MVDPENNSWLVYNRDADNDGRLDPVFVCGPGDPEDFLYRGTCNPDGTRSGDQQSIINNMRTHGVNSIYLQAVRSHGGDGDATHNPFIDSDPANLLDEDILRQWDGWFTAMDNAGIIIYFFFYDDSAQIWSGDTVGTRESYFITSLVNRYEHLKHLVWVVGEEYSERYSAARVSNIAALVKNTDDNRHPVANHQLNGITFDHADDPNIDQFAIQYNDTTIDGLHNGMINAWANAAGRYSINMSESMDHGCGTRAEVRRKNWACSMAGSYVMVIRMDGTSAYNDKMTDCTTLAEFFESTNFNTMSPHDELGNTGTWVMADPGKSYIAYRSSAGNFTISGMAAGSYFLSWLDTVSGAKVEETRYATSGINTFFRPAGISVEAAVWITKITNISDFSPNVSPVLFLLLEK